MIRLAFSSLFLLFIPFTGKGQLNAYAEVTGTDPASVELANVDESADSFEDGENVIIMQMQDSVIGGNTNDDASFGDLEDIRSAGLWEIRKIQSHTESGGVPTIISFKDPLENIYNIGSESSVQIISFPKLGSPDHTISNEQSAPDWNGTTGGVLAFEVPGTLTLESDLDADGAGFRGGSEADGSSGSCDQNSFRIAISGQHASKGEGIQPIQGWFEAGRGKLLNGGGGGNEHNAGGGGGGNFSKGGEGGRGWDCDPGVSGSGLGGSALASDISPFRFFMGGGGGGGEGNDGLSTAGGDGGGILIIKAKELESSSSCSGLSITANGDNAIAPGNDGAGGGGAGGTVHMKVENWNVDASCPLTIAANGGSGGDVDAADAHGGGGGGGQGSIIQAGVTPSSNTSQDTESGTGGMNCNGCSRTEAGGGEANDGVSSGGTSPLPIELVSFEAKEAGDRVKLTWKTLSEKDNERFELYRSKRGENWERFETVEGAGDASSERNYNAYDQDPFTGLTYYQLEQVDYDGKRSSYGPIKVRFEQQEPLSIHPNPTKDRLRLEYSETIENVQVYDHQGRSIPVPTTLNGTKAELSASDLSPGIYFLRIHTPHGIAQERFVKE